MSGQAEDDGRARRPEATGGGVIAEGPKIAALSCGKPVYLVVLLHAEGGEGRAIIDQALNWAPTMPKADFVALEAPVPDPSGAGRRWFAGDVVPDASTAGLADAADALDAALDRMLAQRRLDEDHLALVGVSQGATLALYAAMRRPRPMAAVVSFAGALPDLPEIAAGIRSRPETLLIHGEDDRVVPFAAMLATKARLKAAGVPTRSMRRPGLGHAMDDDGIIAAGDFLSEMVVNRAKAGAGGTHAAEHDHA